MAARYWGKGSASTNCRSTCDCFWDVGSDRRPIRAISEAGQQQKAAEEAAQRLAQQRGRRKRAGLRSKGQRRKRRSGWHSRGLRRKRRSGWHSKGRRRKRRSGWASRGRHRKRNRGWHSKGRRRKRRSSWPSRGRHRKRNRDRRSNRRRNKYRRCRRIRSVQHRSRRHSSVASMGLNTGVANGKMSLRTQEMVRAFQRASDCHPTGELTMALLETLRGTTPPAASRAKSLFTLAAEARNARRLGDATRLYEAALRLAPNDADGLLALGDLRRDANDLVAARRAYETLANGRGAAADIARERLAGLPNQQQPSNAQPARDTASQAAHGQPGEQQASRSGDPSAQINTGAERDRAPAIAAPRILIRQGRLMALIPDCVS